MPASYSRILRRRSIFSGRMSPSSVRCISTIKSTTPFRKSTQRTVSKCFYLYSRYYVFVVHLYVPKILRLSMACSELLIYPHRQHYHYAPLYQHLDPSKPTPPGMANWMLYKFFFWQTLVYVTDLVLCNRGTSLFLYNHRHDLTRICPVYLLYNKRKAILYLLSTILVSRTLLVAISWYMIHTTLKNCTAAARDSLSFKVVGQYM